MVIANNTILANCIILCGTQSDTGRSDSDDTSRAGHCADGVTGWSRVLVSVFKRNLFHLALVATLRGGSFAITGSWGGGAALLLRGAGFSSTAGEDAETSPGSVRLLF